MAKNPAFTDEWLESVFDDIRKRFRECDDMQVDISISERPGDTHAGDMYERFIVGEKATWTFTFEQPGREINPNA